MNYTIVDIYEDMAEKYKVRVDYEEGTIILKFDEFPNNQDIDILFNKYIAIKNSISALN